MKLRGVAAAVAVAAVLVFGAVGCNAISVRLHLNKGNELYKAERYEDAIKEYAKVLESEPNDWTGNYLTAVSYLALYKPGSTHPKDVEYSTNAIKFFEKLLTLTPPTKDDADKVRGYYLSILTSADKRDKAIAYLQAELKKDPSNLGLMGQIADMYQKSGDFPTAIEWHEKIAQAQPNNKENWYTVSVLCWARSYHGGLTVSQSERESIVTKGLDYVDKALAIDPEYFEALSYKNLLLREQAKALAAIGKNMEAGEAYMKADEFQKKAIEVRKKQQAAKAKA